MREQLQEKKKQKAPTESGKKQKRGTNLDYFRCIYAADDNLGRLLTTLDELGLVDNTIVVFASDNGYYLGEHGLGDKRSAYDESLRTPMLLRYPKLGVKGKVVDEMVLNVDLVPTLLDFAGVNVPKEMQGRSWKPLLADRSTDWRKAWFYEYFREREFGVPTVLAVRADTAKLIKYPEHEEWTELFDLQLSRGCQARLHEACRTDERGCERRHTRLRYASSDSPHSGASQPGVGSVPPPSIADL